MSTDAFHRPGPSGMEPPASLTSVRVKRRQSLVTPSGKRGDLTDGGDASAAQDAQEAPSAPEAPMLTQAAMDADHHLPFAQDIAAAPPVEPVYGAPQPVIVLPPPVLNGEDRDALLPMAELLPEVTAAMHEQIRQSEAAAPPFAVETPASEAPSYQPELLLTSPLPAAPEIQPEPEVIYQPAFMHDPEVSAQPEAFHQPEVFRQPEVFHQREVFHQPEVFHRPIVMHQPEVTHQPEAMHEPEMMHEPEVIVYPIVHPEVIAEPEALYEPEIIAEPEIVAELEVEPEPEAEERREPVLTMPPAEASDTVIPLPVAAAEPMAAEPEANAPPDILDYWDGLRGVRDFPVVDELDRSHIAGSWPNIVLLGFKTELPQITRIGENNGDVEFTAMVTSWLMSRGRHAVKRGEAMEEEQKFPVSTGNVRYRLLLLPMMGQGSEVCDHVLCQITRAQERNTGFSFKRWLAS